MYFDWWGKKIELDSKEKSRRNRIMRSKSFKTQKVKEMSWKTAGESKDFHILWTGIIDEDFQIKSKECKDEEINDVKNNAREEARHGIGNSVWAS